MYPILLIIHSFIRWFIFWGVVTVTFKSWYGWLGNKPFTQFDQRLGEAVTRFAQIQFLIGLGLYFLSPLVDYFLHHFSEAIHIRQARFFGMEHITMMTLAVGFISRGSQAPKRRESDQKKFRVMAISFAIALIIILVNIPWPFSPFASRPFFRWF